MNLDPLFISIVKHGGVSGVMIAAALFYLALQVRGLQRSLDRVEVTIGEKVFPVLNDHEGRISHIEGRAEART